MNIRTATAEPRNSVSAGLGQQLTAKTSGSKQQSTSKFHDVAIGKCS